MILTILPVIPPDLRRWFRSMVADLRRPISTISIAA